MKLFTNGCSFTWGGAIYPDLYDATGNLLDYDNISQINQTRLATVWPFKLGQKLLASDTVNLSMGCGSNDRIVRTTLEYFSEELLKTADLSSWTAVIQWSQPHRYEYWDEDTNSWAMVIPNAITFGRRVSPQYQKSKEYERAVTYTYLNDVSFAQKYFSQVVALASFFEQHKIRYFFVNLSTEHLAKLNIAQVEYLKNKIKWIDNNPYTKITRLFTDAYESKHPTIVGHDQIAENFYQFIKNN